MENPFLRRATEFLRDDEAFLAIVSPEPVTYFLRGPGTHGTLYDRLVLVRGTPGSGKTTLARLFEFPTICALLRNQSFAGHKDLTQHYPHALQLKMTGQESSGAGCRWTPIIVTFGNFRTPTN